MNRKEEYIMLKTVVGNSIYNYMQNWKEMEKNYKEDYTQPLQYLSRKNRILLRNVSGELNITPNQLADYLVSYAVKNIID